MAVLLILLLLVHLPASAAAQEISDRAVPATAVEIRDRVARMTDTMRIHELELQFAAPDADHASAASAVAAGLAALRLWEITGDRGHARRSRAYFDRAAEFDATNAWAHYGHALSLEAEMDRDPGTIVTHVNASRALGLDPVSRARRALERAVALDPSLPGAADLLARYAVATRDDEGLLLARTSFELAAASRAGTAALHGLALTARAMGDYAASADAARRAVAAVPTSARAHLELAISLANMSDSLTAAGAAYAHALDLADAAMIEQMWQDAAMLHTEREERLWAESDVSQRREMLRTFWDVRGALSGLTADERAAEHYRRVTVAQRRFARRGMFGASPENALRLGKVDNTYDDRGVIYIRHGQPEHTFGRPPLEDYIAWFFRDESGDPLSYHFHRGGTEGQSQDYVLMYNLPCPLDPTIASFDARLSPLVNARRCDYLNLRSISAVVARDANRALRTDSHRPAFDAAVPFHYDWYTFRADAGTELLMAVGIPLHELPPGQRSLRLRLSVVDTANAAIAHAGTITQIVERSAAPDLLRTHLSLVAEPASSVYRIDVRDASDPRVGTIYGGAANLPDYGGDTLMVSDVMLARQTDDGSLVRGDVRLAPAPSQVFAGGRFRVYYEIYNMPPGDAYVTEITVEPVRDNGIIAGIVGLFRDDESVKLRFEDTAPADVPSRDAADAGRSAAAGPTLPQVRDITAPFRSGPWLLRLTISSESGSITRERRFTIRDP